MVKLRISLLIFAVVYLSVMADFSIISNEGNNISVFYNGIYSEGGKAIILPPNDNYSISVSPSNAFDKNQYRAIYSGDMHLLPLPQTDEAYTISVNYDNTRVFGKRIIPESDIMSSFSDIIINSENIAEFIKPRTPIHFKASYTGLPVLKMRIDSSGIYRVYYSQLNAVTDIELSGINPRNIQLFCKNKEIPLYISNIADSSFNAGDFIEFFAERNDGEGYRYFDKYNIENVYILTVEGNPGSRYVQFTSTISHDSLIAANIESHYRTVHVEADSFFYRFQTVSADTSDFWFDRYMNDPNTYDINIDLNDRIADSPLILTSYLHGVSHLGINPDHPLDIYMNDSIIESINWNDQLPYYYKSDSIVLPDTNEICVTYHVKSIPGDTSSSDSLLFNDIMLNWTELTYERALRPENGYLVFSMDPREGYGRFRFRITGFANSNVEILRKDLKRIIGFNVLYDTLTFTYTVIFEDDIYTTGVQYGVYERSNLHTPDEIERYEYADLASSLNRGKFVIICPQELKEESAEIANLFDEDVFIAGTEDIYNEFSDGFVRPSGIRDFLRAAYNNWEIAPTHVLLLGDASRDQNNHLNKKQYYIPNGYVYGLVDFGYSCSDNYYGRVVGEDVLEDISVSRYPVKTINDIYNLKSKIIHYTDPRNMGTHYLRALMVYDTTEYIRSENDSKTLGSMLPFYLYPKYMHTFQSWGPDFIPELYKGAFVMNVLAHGAIRSIGYGMYLRIFDVYRYNNISRLPLVNVFSCNTTEFDFVAPDTISIGEAFATAPGGGAIGYYGATGTSEAGVNFVLSRAIFRQFTEKGLKNIGDILRIGETEFFLEASNNNPYNFLYYRSQEIMNYNLLGIGFLDLNIPKPSNDELLLSSEDLGAGDTLTVELNSQHIQNGNMESIILDIDKNAISHNHSEIFDSTGTNNLIMPDTVNIGSMTVLTVSSSSDTSLLQYAFPSIGRVGMSTFGMLPAEPDTSSRFIIYAKIKNAGALTEQYAYYKKETAGNYTFVLLKRDSSDTTMFKSDSLGPLTAGSSDYKFLYYISMKDSTSNIINSAKKYYLVKSLPDFGLKTNSLEINSVNRTPVIEYYIENFRGLSIPGFAVEFYEIGTDSAIITIDSIAGINEILSKNYATLNEDVYLNDFTVTMDIYNQINEAAEDNNKIVFENYDHLIILIDDDVEDKNPDFHLLSADIEDRFSNLGSFLCFSRNEFTDSLSTMKMFSESDGNVYEYNIFNGDTVKCDINLSFNDSTLNDEDYNLYAYDFNDSVYVKVSDILDYVNVSLNTGLNKFTIADHTDSLSPYIAILIENSDYVGNVILSEECELSFVIEDESGVRPDDITIILNNDTLTRGEYSISENTDIRNIPIQMTKNLDDGIYDITVIAKDIYSNESTEIMEFKVAQTFAILSAANFPNPVSGSSTVLACRLTENADELIFHLFDSSGRKIRQQSFIPGSDNIFTYDFDVSNLSNGTYLYYFEAYKNGGSEKVKSKIQKMSVLK